MLIGAVLSLAQAAMLQAAAGSCNLTQSASSRATLYPQGAIAWGLQLAIADDLDVQQMI